MEAIDVYLLDLCDAAIGERGERNVELHWLRPDDDPDGLPATVDAWYPKARAAVMLVDEGKDTATSRFALEAATSGVDLLELGRLWTSVDDLGAPRKLDAEAREIALRFGTALTRRENRVVRWVSWVEDWADDDRDDVDDHEDARDTDSTYRSWAAPSRDDSAVAELATAALVASGPFPEEREREWQLTGQGRELAVAWVARCLPLFEGWPPDPDPEHADDAAR